MRGQWGCAALTSLTRRSVRQWVYGELDEGFSVAYVRGMLRVLKMLVRYAVEEMGADPVSVDWGIVWPSKSREMVRRVETYPREDVRRVLELCMAELTPRTVALMVAFGTGLRIGEVCGLMWDDVDLERRMIHVRRTVQRTMREDGRGTFVYVGTPKTQTGTRDVPVVRNLMALLREWKGFHGAGKFVASCGEKPVEPRVFGEWTKRFLRRAGVERVLRFHCIRHTFATTLIEAGVDEKSVSAMMGHSEVATTLDLYVHPSDDAKAEALDMSMSGLFPGGD